MSKKLQLQIPEPCHEDWDKMAPGDKGRFCDSCQKTVHDFTGMSDAQLIAFFKKTSTGSLCGRFLEQQLNRNIEMPRKRITWLKYFFQFTIPIFLTGLKAHSQGQLKLKESRAPATYSTLVPVLAETVGVVEYIHEKKVKGKIIDEHGDGIPYASVIVKNSATVEGTVCDSAGLFELKVIDRDEKIQLVASCIGFSEAEKEINITKGLFTEIGLSPMTVCNKEVVVKAYGAIRKLVTSTGLMASVMGQMTSEKEVTLLQRMKDFFTNKSVKLYPNPVSRSEQISVEFDHVKTERISLRIYSFDGRMVGLKEYEATKGVNRISYSISSQLAAGTYAVQLVDGKKKIIKTEKLIVQL